jgi:hypothetical protein
MRGIEARNAAGPAPPGGRRKPNDPARSTSAAIFFSWQLSPGRPLTGATERPAAAALPQAPSAPVARLRLGLPCRRHRRILVVSTTAPASAWRRSPTARSPAHRVRARWTRSSPARAPEYQSATMAEADLARSWRGPAGPGSSGTPSRRAGHSRTPSSRASPAGCGTNSWNEEIFESLTHARRELERWRLDYNQLRPHSALAGTRRPAHARPLATAPAPTRGWSGRAPARTERHPLPSTRRPPLISYQPEGLP